MSNPFKKRYKGEGAKHLKALWDYYLCNQNLQKVIDHYANSENAPTQSYNTALRWKNKFHWDARILEYQEKLIAEEQIEFEQARREWIMAQLDLLKLHNNKILDCEVDTEMVSMNQFTSAVNTQIKMIQSVFDMEPVSKIAPTTPDGKKPYMQDDIAELMKLADAAKRRPE